MSRRRPSKRDRLEAEFLALAEQRADLVSGAALKRLDEAILAMQRRLDGVEAPRLAEGAIEVGDRRDALEFVPAGALIAPAGGPGIDEPIMDDISAESAGDPDWKMRAGRLLNLTVGMLRNVTYAKSKPRLEAFAGLFALGVDCDSMRTVAAAEGVSLEWVSQKAEQVRLRFNLPKNQHNKSDRAVESYSATANLKGKAS